jgi:hypothetical protein
MLVLDLGSWSHPRPTNQHLHYNQTPQVVNWHLKSEKCCDAFHVINRNKADAPKKKASRRSLRKDYMLHINLKILNSIVFPSQLWQCIGLM